MKKKLRVHTYNAQKECFKDIFNKLTIRWAELHNGMAVAKTRCVMINCLINIKFEDNRNKIKEVIVFCVMTNALAIQGAFLLQK